MNAQWTREELVERLLAAAPTVGPYLVEALRPAVRLVSVKTAEEDIPVGSSKFGGGPDLPHGSSWPAWTNREGQQRPMQFFAQVDLSAAARVARGPLGLPGVGLLSAFADFDLDDDLGITGRHRGEQSGAVLVYSPPDAALERFSPPVPSLPPAQLALVPVWTWPQEPAAGLTLTDSEYGQLVWIDMRYEASLRAVRRTGYQSGRHQLGGHARYAQHPVEKAVLMALCRDEAGELDTESWEATKHQAPDWQVVFQIDSDESLGLLWSDGGTLYWAMHQQDLDAGLWDRAMFNFQCH